jgi:2'-5' RNA ligase
MRLFVALSLPPAVAADLDAAVTPLRTAWPQLRWTTAADWHLTLAFLGEVGDEATAALSGQLAEAAGRRRAVQLALAGAGAFPAARRGRVLWAGLRSEEMPLLKLARAVAKAARDAGAPPPGPRRRFHPHLTLARAQHDTDLRPLTTALDGYASSEWTGGQIELIRSRLQQAPRYEVIGRWPLRPADQPASEPSGYDRPTT